MIRRRSTILLFVLLSLALTWGCSRKKKVVVFPDEPIRAASAEAQRSFDEALAHLEAGRYREAIDGFRLLQAQYPDDAIATLAELYAARAQIGELAVLRPAPRPVADVALSRLAQLGADRSVDDRIRYAAAVYYASGLATMGQGNEAALELKDYPSPGLSPAVIKRDRSDAQALVAESLLRGGRFGEAMVGFGGLYELAASTEDVVAYAKSRAFESAANLDEEALVDYAGSESPFVRAISGWTLLDRRAGRASDDETKALLELLRRTAPDIAEIGESARLESLSAALASRGPARRLAVGVVLPLSGASANAGRRVLEGALVATGAFQDAEQSVTVVFVDSNKTQAREGMARFRSLGVSAVVGPLDAKKAGEWAQAANQEEVPLFALTTERLGSDAGDWAFRWFIDAESEARATARVAVQEQGDQRIALVYPNIGYGRRMAQWFRQEAEARGATIVFEEEYDRSATDYTRLAGRIGAASPDSLYIPDTAAKVGELTAFLAQANVWGLDGQRRPAPRSKRKQVHYLGTSLWNDPALIQQSASYVTGALIPAWSSSTFRDDKNTRFFDAYSRATGRNADDLAAFAYETVRFVRGAFDAGVSDPLGLREAARSNRAYRGVTGATRFTKGGEPVRQMRFITIDGSGFVPSDRTATVGLPDES